MNEIINGNCMELMPSLPDNSFEMTLTDVPYAVVSRPTNGLRIFDKDDADRETFDLELFLKECERLTRGSIYVFCSTEQVSLARSTLAGLRMSTRLCILEKTNPSPANGQHLWLSGVECCVFGRKKGAVFHEHCKNPVWRYPVERGKLHPTQKPLGLFRYLVRTSSNPGDVIFDPCAGSGTTPLAAKLEGRNFTAFELNKEYCRLANARLGEGNPVQVVALADPVHKLMAEGPGATAAACENVDGPCATAG